MLVKYASFFALTAIAACTASSVPSEASPSTPPPIPVAGVGEFAWSEVTECYRKPQAAIGCLETRMYRALRSMRDTAVRRARSDPNTAAEDAAGVGDLVQQIGEFITYGISSYFRGDAAVETEDEPTGASSPVAVGASSPTDVDEGRGSHKKKKIQKEIKKFVLKVLFGIYLFKQKIKMILMSIQSILMSKFLIVAMVYALSNTFKIWWDIKASKHHHHDKVVYYENAHHQHHYEPPEHSDYEEHSPHGFGGSGIWGRSIAVTEPSGSGIEHHGGPPGGPHDGIGRYIRRVSRIAAEAQAMAFNGQAPYKQ